MVTESVQAWTRAALGDMAFDELMIGTQLNLGLFPFSLAGPAGIKSFQNGGEAEVHLGASAAVLYCTVPRYDCG